jgi:NADPH:quinone reductase-like Zn-dependent oxidoreductase
MMRAVLLDQCGAPPSIGDRDSPTAADGELVVRVTAASITPLDLLCASGTSYFGAPATPYVPGVQGVGELPDGTAVWFATTAGMRPGDGSMAEYAVVRPADTVALPDGVDHRLIAALGLSAVAAYMALTWRGGLQPGEQVLVLGAGGVVGQAGIQLALLGGARRVIAAARSSSSRERALRLGAAACISSTGADVGTLAAEMNAAADGPVDLVLDPLFGVPAAAALRTLRSGGVLVNLGGSAGETAPFDSATLRSGSLSVLGYTNNNLTADQRAQALEVIAEHVRAGRLTADFEAVSFAEIGEAWSRQAGGNADRRIVLVP